VQGWKKFCKPLEVCILGTQVRQPDTVAGVASEKLGKSRARGRWSAKQVVHRIHEIGSVTALRVRECCVEESIVHAELKQPRIESWEMLGRILQTESRIHLLAIHRVIELWIERQLSQRGEDTVSTYGATLKNCALQLIGTEPAQDLEQEGLNGSEDIVCNVEEIGAWMRFGKYKRQWMKPMQP
jgi:hypothetical protein